ncbi:MAG: DEAD/DEAH box helicase family protein [Flavobacteriaceae bacterium]|nr:DEAD/DEAH box helicase family protein [Flavobacteriaceae bacterium]
MSPLFKNLKFSFSWRSYQETFLKNFSSHISDNHFHVIAPPGSGKTILGIEIIKQLGKKALVLAPTITIRNQWEDRLQNFFTKNNSFKEYSFNIKSLSDITFTTYQSLHAFYKTFENKEKYFEYFQEQGLEVLVLDEAHHLKNAWWESLYDLKNSKALTVVALTATPPYDSETAEITKYFKLCGEIDDEIATPDLVKEGDLCPHQDFVYLSKPEDVEINFIVDFRRKITTFIDILKKDSQFISFLQNHRFYSDPRQSLDELYSNSEFFSAILIFLNASGKIIPFEKLEILGFDKNEKIQFPELTNNWVEILLQNLLINDRQQLYENEDYLLSLEKKLKRLNIYDKNKINLIGNKEVYISLSNSPSKLKSIVSIIASEYKNLKEDLRAVILTDYIRKEFLNTSDENIKDINKLGVIPIFHNLRVSSSDKKVIAVLSGSIVIIHATLLANFDLRRVLKIDFFSFLKKQEPNFIFFEKFIFKM